MLAPINTEKHIKQISLTPVAIGAVGGEELVKAVAVADKNLVKEVRQGAVVKAIYIELWIQSAVDTGLGQVTAIVEKTSLDDVGATATDFVTGLFAYNNKKNILYTTQGLTPTLTTNNPQNFLKGWLKIPKGKQRFGLGDTLQLRIHALGEALQFCGVAIFKEYS